MNLFFASFWFTDFAKQEPGLQFHCSNLYQLSFEKVPNQTGIERDGGQCRMQMILPRDRQCHRQKKFGLPHKTQHFRYLVGIVHISVKFKNELGIERIKSVQAVLTSNSTACLPELIGNSDF